MEQRLWFCWLYGNTYNLPTAWVLMNEFPDYELATYDRINAWNSENYSRLRYQTDTKWNKGHLAEMFASYQKFIGDGTQLEKFESLYAGSPGDTFDAIWDAVKTNLHKFGRYGTWFYLQHLRQTAGLDLEPSTLMLGDYSGSKSHRNGLLLALGRDNEQSTRLTKEAYSDLETESRSILEEVRERFPALAGQADYFSMETCLCSFKKIFRPKRSRYLGFYLNRQADEIRKAEKDGWFGIEWEVIWEARREMLDHRLSERAPPEYEKIFVDNFLDTGAIARLPWFFSDETTFEFEETF